MIKKIPPAVIQRLCFVHKVNKKKNGKCIDLLHIVINSMLHYCFYFLDEFYLLLFSYYIIIFIVKIFKKNKEHFLCALIL